MVYTGTPADILNRLSREIGDVLMQSGMPPSGIHALALMHVACSIMRNHQEEFPMPSFKVLLAMIMHSLNGTPFSPENASEFNAEFCQMVEAMGGGKMEKPAKGFTWTAPMGEC